MSIFATLTEGGQTWIHRVRMIRQVLKIASFASLLCCGFIFYLEMHEIPNTAYVAAFYNVKAHVCELLLQDSISVDTKMWEKIANERRSNPNVPIKVVKAKTFRATRYIFLQFKKNANFCFQFCGVAFAGVLLFFLIRGRGFRNSQHISGRKVVSATRLKWKLFFSRKAFKIKIGKLPMVKGSETCHTLITGGTGSGKSNCIFGILDQLREQGHKTIIVDTTGSYVERYHQPGKDFILNPLDERSEKWHPWAECEDRSDYEALAESFIPTSMSDNENYWRLAARSLMSSVLLKLKHQRKTSGLCRWLLIESLENLCEFVQGTKAASHIDTKSEKTAGSIRSVTSSFVECFEHLEDTENPFSIKDWVQKEDNGWLFLCCSPKQRTVMRPLLSSWISVATRSLFDLPPSLSRRVWFILDELPSMQKVKDLDTFLAESRKYGGCGIISLQSPSQLESIYGRSVAETIVLNCATKVVFAEKNPKIAEEISRSFGKKESKEYSEGISYGANDIRDGVNLSSQKKENYCVSATQIQSLKSNTAYINLPENVPIGKVKLNINKKR